MNKEVDAAIRKLIEELQKEASDKDKKEANKGRYSEATIHQCNADGIRKSISTAYAFLGRGGK